MMKRLLTYGCLLALATLLSCTREKVPAPLCAPGSTVDFSFSTIDLQATKATTPGDGSAADGGGIAGTTADPSKPDLVILIANNISGHADYGNIVMAYPTSGTLQSSSSTQATIKFDFSAKPAGDYIVYAFGNTEGLWEMTTNGSDTYSGATLTTLTTAAQVEALYFTAQSRNTVGWEDAGYDALPAAQKYDDGLTVKNTRLPLSAKASLTVSSGKNGEAYLELIRCVAKVTAVIVNNTGSAMNLYNYKHTVHGINPTSGYVIPHEDDVTGTAANLLANPCVKYGDSDLYIPITSDGSQTYNWYVFPSNGPYTICLTFTLNKGNPEPVDPSDPPAEKTYTYNKLPITNWRAENIPALGRNQHITVTTRISKGLTVSFNFEVNEWTEHTNSVEFL